MQNPFGSIEWGHVIEGFLVGVGVATALGLVRFLNRTQRRIKREHHHLLHWARVAGRHIGIKFPLDEDQRPDDDQWDEGLR